MMLMRVKPVLVVCILCLVGVFAQAQPNSGEKLLLAQDFAKMKGNLPWPADNIKELLTHKQLVENVKKQFHVNASPLKTLTIRCDEATTVKAVADGIVQRIFNIENSWSVLVKHGDYMLVYSNLDTVFLKNGDLINTMQPVGRITSRAFNNYYELEMLLYKNRKDLDPFDWFKPIENSENVL
jgi:murein DD-endopeptidase MepM/ murein hydrolase activator NlpD